MCQIQDCVTQQHQQLLMLAPEESGQRLLARLNDDSFAHPLPELSLCRPKLFSITADHERGLLLPLFLHLDTPRRLRVVLTQKPPWGSLSREAAVNCQRSGCEQNSSHP